MSSIPHRIALFAALVLAGCHSGREAATPPPTSSTTGGEGTGPAAAARPPVQATSETSACGLPVFETARGTRVAMTRLPVVARERLGSFDFLSHVVEDPGFVLELDEYTLPTDAGDGREVLEPLAQGQIVGQTGWELTDASEVTVAGRRGIRRAYRLEDGTERREIYVAVGRLAVRLVSEATHQRPATQTLAIECFESSLVLPPTPRP
ncbi:MAG: hypothetical protein U0230_04805 [Polyangiales bacterium]